jgi:hypothetical protein
MLINFELWQFGVFLALHRYSPEWDVHETRLTLWSPFGQKTFGKSAKVLGRAVSA